MSSDVETQKPEETLSPQEPAPEETQKPEEGQKSGTETKPGTADVTSDEETAKLATAMAEVVEQALERIRPFLKIINEEVEKANKTDPEELDEEALVEKLKPIIEEASAILHETLGRIKGMDPEGKIANQATRNYEDHHATPEEQRLAKALAELTGDVTKTIENAKEKIKDMPKAGPKLGALLGLLSDPLFQILSAVGLLLNGVLTLVGNILDAIGLGGLIRGILAGLGLEKILKSLGFGKIFPGLKEKQPEKGK